MNPSGEGPHSSPLRRQSLGSRSQSRGRRGGPGQCLAHKLPLALDLAAFLTRPGPHRMRPQARQGGWGPIWAGLARITHVPRQGEACTHTAPGELQLVLFTACCPTALRTWADGSVLNLVNTKPGHLTHPGCERGPRPPTSDKEKKPVPGGKPPGLTLGSSP